MIVEYANFYLFKTEILNRYFKIFLIYLSRQLDGVMSPVAHTRKTELVHSFNEALEKHFRKKKMVADYADILFISSNYLNMIIKEETGHSAGYHIRQRIALEAKKMALYSANNMKEIAYHLGFPDSTHFSKFFKATTGNNFTVYKKEKLSLTIQEHSTAII
jgi:YesN/AraC family two-component response regulator